MAKKVSERPRLLRLARRSGAGARVLVPGLRAPGSAAELLTLRRELRALDGPGADYLYRWSSGDWLPERTALAFHVALRAGRWKSALNPGLLAADVGLWAAGQWLRFKFYERRARRLGPVLARDLRRVHAERGDPIDLVAHSLGTTMLLHALAGQPAEAPPLRHVVLLGGVVDARAGGWEAVAARLGGRLLNVYSRRDLALRLMPDRVVRLGEGPLRLPPELAGKVSNFDCTPLGHTDYWRRLARILAALPGG